MLVGPHGYEKDLSFIFPPGKKSLSMSNLVGGGDDGDVTCASSVISAHQYGTVGSQSNISTSSSNLHRMKAFLSSKHLEQVQISLVSKHKVRNTLIATGSDGALSVHPSSTGTLQFGDRGWS